MTKRRMLGILLTGAMLISLWTTGSLTAAASLSRIPAQTTDVNDGIIDTAARVSEWGWTEGSDYAVLASSEEQHLIDAVLATPLAVQKNAPILFTEGERLTPQTKQKLRDLGVNYLYIVGGDKVISQAIREELGQLGVNLIDLGGQDRFETAANIAAELGPSNQVFVVNASSVSDILLAASAATLSHSPILLSYADNLPGSVKRYLTEMEDQLAHSVIVGGSRIIDSSVEVQLPSAMRVGGVDRYHTNVLLLEHYQNRFNQEVMMIYCGEEADIGRLISVSSLTGSLAIPVILNNPNPNDSVYLERIRELLGKYIPSKVIVLGESEQLSDSVRAVIGEAGITPEQLLAGIPIAMFAPTKYSSQVQTGSNPRYETLDNYESSGEEPLAEEPPAEESSDEPPADEPPAEEPPAEEPSVEEPPVEEPSVEEPPVEEPPVEEPSVEEPPVEEPPIGEPLDPPILSQVQATVDLPFSYDFEDHPDWRTHVHQILINDTILPATAYTIDVGRITFFPENSELLQQAGLKQIVIEAVGYDDLILIQELQPGEPSELIIAKQPEGPEQNKGILTVQPELAIHDQYGNLCRNAKDLQIQAMPNTISWSFYPTQTPKANVVDGRATFEGLRALRLDKDMEDAIIVFELLGTDESAGLRIESSPFSIPQSIAGNVTGKITTPGDGQTLKTMVSTISGTVNDPDSDNIYSCKIAIIVQPNFYLHNDGSWKEAIWHEATFNDGEWEFNLNQLQINSINNQKQVTIVFMASDNGELHGNHVECDRITVYIQK